MLAGNSLKAVNAYLAHIIQGDGPVGVVLLEYDSKQLTQASEADKKYYHGRIQGLTEAGYKVIINCPHRLVKLEDKEKYVPQKCNGIAVEDVDYISSLKNAGASLASDITKEIYLERLLFHKNTSSATKNDMQIHERKIAPAVTKDALILGYVPHFTMMKKALSIAKESCKKIVVAGLPGGTLPAPIIEFVENNLKMNPNTFKISYEYNGMEYKKLNDKQVIETFVEGQDAVHYGAAADAQKYTTHLSPEAARQKLICQPNIQHKMG